MGPLCREEDERAAARLLSKDAFSERKACLPLEDSSAVLNKVVQMYVMCFSIE